MIHPDLLELLSAAMRTAQAPLLAHDFESGQVIQHDRPDRLEERVRGWLLTKDPQAVSSGLANVLYWLSQRDGEGGDRIYEFRAKVNSRTLVEALRLFDWLEGPGLVRIANLELPVFRDLPTTSALRMVLDPLRYACITPALLGLRELAGRSVLHELTTEEGLVPVSLRNEAVYERWCAACRALAALVTENGGPDRGAAVVERGLGALAARGEGREALLLLQGVDRLSGRGA